MGKGVEPRFLCVNTEQIKASTQYWLSELMDPGRCKDTDGNRDKVFFWQRKLLTRASSKHVICVNGKRNILNLNI